MRWGEVSGNKIKRWQEFQVHHPSEIWVIYVELLVGLLRSVDSSLVWYVLHCQFGSSVFLCLSNASKTSKTWKNLKCVLDKSSGCDSALWILRESWRLRQLHTWWCVLCIFASVFCMEKLYLNMRFQSWLGVDKYSSGLWCLFSVNLTCRAWFIPHRFNAYLNLFRYYSCKYRRRLKCQLHVW